MEIDVFTEICTKEHFKIHFSSKRALSTWINIQQETCFLWINQSEEHAINYSKCLLTYSPIIICLSYRKLQVLYQHSNGRKSAKNGSIVAIIMTYIISIVIHTLKLYVSYGNLVVIITCLFPGDMTN